MAVSGLQAVLDFEDAELNHFRSGRERRPVWNGGNLCGILLPLLLGISRFVLLDGLALFFLCFLRSGVQHKQKSEQDQLRHRPARASLTEEEGHHESPRKV